MNNLLTNGNWKSAALLVAASAVLIALLVWMPTDRNITKAQAQTPDDAVEYTNMDSMLNSLVEQYETGAFMASAAASNAPVSNGGSVGVIFLTESGAADNVRAYLLENGASPGPSFGDHLGAEVPVSLLASAAQQDGVNWMHAAVPLAEDQAFSLSSDVAPETELWHQAGIKGAGIKIAVITLGFQGFQDLMGSELPDEVKARCYAGFGVYTLDIADCEEGATFGAAVTSQVYDVAPDATYYIARVNDWVEFNETAKWLIQEEVDVVVSAISFVWTGPGDGTSPYPLSDLNTVADAVEAGITWVTGVSNDGGDAWFGKFTDPDANAIHNFSEDAECNTIETKAGEEYYGIIRWEDNWPISVKDLDLNLVDKETSQLVRKSRRSWLGEDAPVEFLYFEPFADGTYCLNVVTNGEPPGWLQYLSYLGPGVEHHTLNGTINSPGESNSAGLIAVGAVDRDDTSKIQEYGNRGPTPDGRIKPDIVGGPGGKSELIDGWYRKFGTSLGAAEVGGMAALVKQRFPEFQPQDIAAYLKSNAVDRGEPGPDNTWGHGHAVLPASDATAPLRPDVCIQQIYGDQTIEGMWDDSCLSENRPVAEDRPIDGEYYARFYTIVVGADKRVTINLTSERDAYLYLLKGAGKDGEIEARNDDVAGSNDKNSRIVVDNLPIGEYTIEATTYNSEVSGDFNLTVQLTDANEEAPSPPEPPPSPRGPFTDFSRGADHVCALHLTGSVACWGDDEYGQASPPTGSFSAISSGVRGSCALRSDGAVLCWGIFDVDPLTDDAAAGPFTEASRGSDHACALGADGSITCWGSNARGQATPPTGKFSAVGSHDGGSCALRSNGAIVCWGNLAVKH